MLLLPTCCLLCMCSHPRLRHHNALRARVYSPYVAVHAMASRHPVSSHGRLSTTNASQLSALVDGMILTAFFTLMLSLSIFKDVASDPTLRSSSIRLLTIFGADLIEDRTIAIGLRKDRFRPRHVVRIVASPRRAQGRWGGIRVKSKVFDLAILNAYWQPEGTAHRTPCGARGPRRRGAPSPMRPSSLRRLSSSTWTTS